MGVQTTTYPMAIGQLSVYRDVEQMPAERLWEANLAFSWALRRECTLDELWAALAALAVRHESLRTNFVIDEEGRPRQFLVAETAEQVLARAELDTADLADLEKVQPAKTQQAIDIFNGLPWRACALLGDGVPKHLILIVHHITADGAAGLILQDDFHALLAGEELAPAGGQPIAMAQDQQGASAHRLRAAERYWRRTLDSAPRLTGQRPDVGKVLGATMYTGIPLEQAHEGAAKLDVSISTVVVTAYYRALREISGNSAFLLMPMSHNRFDASTAPVVMSLNQWVPLLLDLPVDQPLDELARAVHWKAFNAFKNGICDPDYIVAVREEFFDRAEPPVDGGYYLNTILAPPGFAPAPPAEPSRLEVYSPARATPSGFYLIARGIGLIDFIVRSDRPEVDQEKIGVFLESVRATLQEVAGLAG